MASDTRVQGQTGRGLDGGLGRPGNRSLGGTSLEGKRRIGGMTGEWGQELFSRNGDEFPVRHFPFRNGI